MRVKINTGMRSPQGLYEPGTPELPRRDDVTLRTPGEEKFTPDSFRSVPTPAKIVAQTPVREEPDTHPRQAEDPLCGENMDATKQCCMQKILVCLIPFHTFSTLMGPPLYRGRHP